MHDDATRSERDVSIDQVAHEFRTRWFDYGDSTVVFDPQAEGRWIQSDVAIDPSEAV